MTTSNNRLFPEGFIERVRDSADLPALVSKVVKLKRSGKRFVGRCPFHDDRTPSFYVYPDRNTFRCYGCPAKGDAFEWLKRQHGLPFYEAVAELAKSAGLELPAREQPTEEDLRRRQYLARLYKVLQVTLASYQHGLRVLPSSRAYLEKRKISDDTITRFQLGAVASGVLHLARGFSNQELVAAGVAWADPESGATGERLRYRVIFPIFSGKGNLVGFAGRSLFDKPDKTPKYLNSPQTELFDKGRELYGLHLAKEPIRQSRTAVVVEGYFDVLRAHQEGDTRVVAPMGTAISAAQITALYKDCDVIVFAFDGDRAGHRAALRAAASVLEVISDQKQARFLFLPGGDDPDSFISAEGIAVWKSKVEESVPLSQFLCSYVSHRLDRSVPESQMVAVDRANQVLARVQKALVYRVALRNRFEEIIGVPVERGVINGT